MHKYVKVNSNLYINSNISMIKVLILLLFQSKPFMGRSVLQKSKRLIKVFSFLIFNKIKNINNIKLPINGHIAMVVSGENYKIFNLKENHVYTLYAGDFIFFLNRQLEISNANEMCPKVIEWDEERKITKEKLYNGYHPLINKNDKIENEFEDLLLNLVLKSNIQKAFAPNYYNRRYHAILELVNENADYIITDLQKNKIKTFVSKIYNTLDLNRELNNISIPLTLTHGDLKSNNLIEHEGNLILIDWEYSEYRTPSFDTLYFLYNSKDEIIINQRNTMLKEIFLRGQINDELLSYFNLDDQTIIYIFCLEYIHLRLLQSRQRTFAKDIDLYVMKFIDNITKLDI
ncbi:phosphotransferase [Alteribacter natronophilus]|uniref:phosphotransferase n=1 Tax=Alteribacter natronophilus TaxID=2583810 RepID=UPI001486C4DA|nr:phosphotransferase [Alteribacter natronophilus]